MVGAIGFAPCAQGRKTYPDKHSAESKGYAGFTQATNCKASYHARATLLING